MVIPLEVGADLPFWTASFPNRQKKELLPLGKIGYILHIYLSSKIVSYVDIHIE